MSIVKVRYKRGDNEIEVEGTKTEVEDILRAWWSGPASQPPSAEHKEKKRPAKKGASAKSAKPSTDPAYDALSFANALKEHADYSKMEKQVLHKTNMFNKIALVLRHSDEGLTSGQVAAALLALNIKADVGNLSNCIKSNSGKFIPTAVRRVGEKPKYKLTSQARAAFDEWFAGAQG